MSVLITRENRKHLNKALPVTSIIEWKKFIVYIILSSFSWRCGRRDLTQDQRWKSRAIIFLGGLFQIWHLVFHMYNNQADVWKILNTHVKMIVRWKLMKQSITKLTLNNTNSKQSILTGVRLLYYPLKNNKLPKFYWHFLVFSQMSPIWWSSRFTHSKRCYVRTSNFSWSLFLGPWGFLNRLNRIEFKFEPCYMSQLS